MTTFFLIRHASCDGLGQMLWGRTPGICLNETGKMQAQCLSDRFKNMELDAIYSSPLERALQTASVFAESMKLDVQTSDAVNEINFGDWTGKTFDELSRDKRWRHFNSRRSVTMIPGGESFLDVQNRIVKELETLALQHRQAHVAIISHADVIRAAIAYFSAIPIDLVDRFEISPCSVSVVAMDDNATLLTLNNTGELNQLWT
ncbi:MAG TPA: histidine phosphatase family protein [Pyrinomonadaceae bacterium]|nr:histidine phosphatase family protein [Pyrinomonadaceae bacterium]